MLLVNISRDILVVENASRREEIVFGQLEKHYPVVLKQMVLDEGVKELIVINGPGGFASLRSGCLAINLLQMLTDKELILHDISKPQLYQHAYQQGVLPRYCYLYIGQKKNLRLYDLHEGSYRIVNETTISVDQPAEYCIDDIQSHQLLGFLASDQMVSVSLKDSGFSIGYQQRQWTVDISRLPIETKHYLMPNYMMEPTIG